MTQEINKPISPWYTLIFLAVVVIMVLLVGFLIRVVTESRC